MKEGERFRLAALLSVHTVQTSRPTVVAMGLIC